MFLNANSGHKLSGHWDILIWEDKGRPVCISKYKMIYPFPSIISIYHK